jgi:hypothetical protein
MGTEPRRRHTVRAHPASKVGKTVTLSFRVPSSWQDLLDNKVAELVAAGDDGIENRSDALQDALIVWLLIEGVQ